MTWKKGPFIYVLVNGSSDWLLGSAFKMVWVWKGVVELGIHRTTAKKSILFFANIIFFYQKIFVGSTNKHISSRTIGIKYFQNTPSNWEYASRFEVSISIPWGITLSKYRVTRRVARWVSEISQVLVLSSSAPVSSTPP